MNIDESIKIMEHSLKVDNGIYTNKEKEALQTLLKHTKDNNVEWKKNLLQDLCKINLFKGKYDALNGNEHYMYGINSVMEHIAYSISDSEGYRYNEMFYENLLNSQKKARQKFKKRSLIWKLKNLHLWKKLS